MSDETSADLECPICLEAYNLSSRQPRLLLCNGAHEICKQCVDFLPTTQRANGRGLGFQCPSCRELVPARSNPNRGLIASLNVHCATRKQVKQLEAAVDAARKAEQDAKVRDAIQRRQDKLPALLVPSLLLAIGLAFLIGTGVRWNQAPTSSSSHHKADYGAIFAGDTVLSTVSIVQHVHDVTSTGVDTTGLDAMLNTYIHAHGGDRKLDSEERAWRRDHRAELKKLARRSHALQPHALWLWGKLLNSGRVPDTPAWERIALAEKAWREASARGHALSMNALGGLLQGRNQLDEAHTWWTKAVELAAIPEASYNLGVCYGKGEGGREVDLLRAATFYRHAATITPPEDGGAKGSLKYSARKLWTHGSYTESFDDFQAYARKNLKYVEQMQQRVLDPEGFEVETRDKLDKAFGDSNEGYAKGGIYSVLRDQIVAKKMREYDAALTQGAVWWTEDSEDPENYCRLVDACLLAVEDAYTVDGEVIGPYAEAAAGKTNGALGYLSSFLVAAGHLQALPPWWESHHARGLLELAEDELSDCYIHHAIEWRDAVHIWGESTARVLRALGKRIDGAIENRDSWMANPDMSEERIAELTSQPEFPKFSRLVSRYAGDLNDLLANHPEMADFAGRMGLQKAKLNPTSGIKRRQRRIPSNENLPSDSGSAPLGRDANSAESAALREQRKLLKVNPGMDYVVIDYPTTASDAGIFFKNEMGSATFRSSMEKAAAGDARAVKSMYNQLSTMVTQQLGAKALPAIRKQLEKEFGVDPLSVLTESEGEDDYLLPDVDSMEIMDRVMETLMDVGHGDARDAVLKRFM